MFKVSTASGAELRIDPRRRQFLLLKEPNAAEPLHVSKGQFLDVRAEPHKPLIIRLSPQRAVFMSAVVSCQQM